MAIKIIDKKKLVDQIDKQRLEREINILKYTFHYNVIKIYQVKENDNTICMIMEYAEGGELFNYIIEKGSLSENESRNIFQQIIDAVYYLHQIGICHRDLKPENILFDSKDKKRIKIIDFGLSNLYMAGSLSNNNNISFSDRKDLLETPCGSPGYAPPEMILGCKYDGIMTDIWSSGVILYAMLCGCLPFDDFSEDKLYSKIIKGNFVFPPMIEISKEVKNLINSILVVNPKQRYSIDDIRKNKWFLKNYRPTVGLFISICEIPVSKLIIEEMKKRGYDEKKVTDCIKNNNHNSLTTIYYLLVKQKLKQGIETESDLISNIFQEFIKEQNIKNQKENISPISLKLYIIRSKKNLLKSREKSKEREKEKEAKKKSNSKNKDKKESEINKENILNINKENKSKESKSKETENNRRDNNSKNDKNKKNKTISKEKHQGLNNIQINNIKNIHLINITDIKTNLLVKTCDSNNSKIKLYKKITQLSKNRKEGSNSNSKKKGNKLNTININKMKEGQFRNYMNLQHIKKNTTSSKKKKIKKEKENRVKNNKTCVGELNSNQINKDFNISMNNNENRNNSITSDKKMINKGNFLYNGININNHDKLIMNYKIKLKKTNNFNVDNMVLHKLYLYQIKNGELIKQKSNSRKKFMKELDNIPKKNNLKLESIPKMSQLLNDFRTSRTGQNRYIISSVSNSQSKSKSKSRTGGTHTSNSSNSKSKSNSIRDRLKRESFLAFKSSRNNYNKSKSGNKNIESNYTNLTQERLSNLKSKKLAHTLCRDKNSSLQNKKELNQRNTHNKRCNTKCTNSKSKKKITSKPKNNSNNTNYYYKLQNFNTSIGRRHKIKKKIKTKNHIHILINDINNKNIILRHNTNFIENKRLNDNSNSTNLYSDAKQNQSLNFGVIVNQNNYNGIKSNNNISLKKNVKNESLNINNNLKLKRNEQIPKDNFMIANHSKQKNENKKLIINNIKKNVKEKINFHVVNNHNKLKEYNKYSTINNPQSNHEDCHSNDFYNDLVNLKISAKNKLNKIINKTKINKNNEIKKISKKKIQVGDLKSFQIKNFPYYQDIKPQTYRKEKKYLDEPVSSNDFKSKDNNLIHHFANFSNNSINN